MNGPRPKFHKKGHVRVALFLLLTCPFLMFWDGVRCVQAEIGGRILTKRERMAETSASVRVRSVSIPQSAYQKIHESFLKEEYSQVELLASQYLSQNSGAADVNDVLYLQALSLLKLDRSDEARQKLRQLEAATPNAELKANASASIGDSYYYAGDHRHAYESYKETMEKYPKSDQSDYLRGRLMELSSEFGYTPAGAGPPKNILLSSRLKQASSEETLFYTVQVGSFSRPRNADELTAKLLRQGYSAYMADDKSHGMSRVRVGRFSSKSDAASTESKLKREGSPTKIIP